MERLFITSAPCINPANRFSGFANENFLITLANKGLYKRALKDLESVIEVKLSCTDNTLEIGFSDVDVILHEDIAESTCSCPSKTVCKHVIMGILLASEYIKSEIPNEKVQPIEQDEEPYSELKNINFVLLKKQAGKKLFEDCMQLIHDGWGAQFTETEMLSAALTTEEISVYFPASHSIERAVCKCGEKGLCKHKLIAILSYAAQYNPLPENISDSSSVFLSPETVEALNSGILFILSVFEKGLISCGENDIEKAIRLSLTFESAGIGNLSRLFRSTATDIENMLSKHTGFDQAIAFSTLSRLYNTCALLIKHQHNQRFISSLIESNRADYYTTPVGHFIGLGAYPWQTRSGYTGISVLLYHREKQRICTYSVSLADFYEKTSGITDLDYLNSRMNRNEHWGENSLKSISESCFVLRNFKSTARGRISSSNQTNYEAESKTLPQMVNDLSLNDFNPAPETYDYFEKKKENRVIAFLASKTDGLYFEKSTQKLHFELTNDRNEKIDCSIPYSPLYKKGIRFIEMQNRNKSFPYYFICLAGKKEFFPVSILSSTGITNLFFQ